MIDGLIVPNEITEIGRVSSRGASGTRWRGFATPRGVDPIGAAALVFLVVKVFLDDVVFLEEEAFWEGCLAALERVVIATGAIRLRGSGRRGSGRRGSGGM